MTINESVLLTKDSLVAAKLEMLFDSSVLAGGTCFFYRNDDEVYLITNCHNVTGRDPITKKIISKSLTTPNSIRVTFIGVSKNGTSEFFEIDIPLYSDEDSQFPNWWVHPIHKDVVDIAVIPLPQNFIERILQRTEIVAANDSSVNNLEVPVKVGQDVMTIGFPRMMDAEGFPIWKRGSLATQPGQSLMGLPKFYIDTATREGMSGSPVFTRSIISVRIPGKQISGIGVRNRFIGIYSGRVGDDTFLAQLGIVWEEAAILETIIGKKVGESSF